MSKFRLIAAVLFALFFASSVHAADIAVDADCSLADAIIAANNDRAEGNCPAGRNTDTIILSQDITLDGSLPKITSDITIEGNGYTISGNNRYRIFYNDGGALIINNLTMTKGRVENKANADDSLKANETNPVGGAILNWQGTLTISDSSFSDNSAEWGGAILNDGELSISDSNFSDNSAKWGGGAIYNWKDGELSISDSSFNHNSTDAGGAINNDGELSVTNSAFQNNSALRGGAIFNGADGELSISDISDSSFSYNSAGFAGGAIVNATDGELSISDSSFNHNSADAGGAITNLGELSIVNSTFSHNSADVSSAIFNVDKGELSMVNSIIAGTAVACYSESRLRHNINNFIQDGSCSSDFSGDPMLGELVEPEDGSPAYFPLLASSPAIDAADDEYCPATDQIGTARPQGAGCDIGAIEYVAP